MVIGKDDEDASSRERGHPARIYSLPSSLFSISAFQHFSISAFTSPLIPWHFRQHHRHATPVGDARKYQTRTHKRAQPIKRGMHPSSKNHAQKHQHSRRNSNLTLERHRLCPTHHRQACALPRDHATIEHIQVFTPRRLQLLVGLLRTLATAAHQHTTLGPARSGPHHPPRPADPAASDAILQYAPPHAPQAYAHQSGKRVCQKRFQHSVVWLESS